MAFSSLSFPILELSGLVHFKKANAPLAVMACVVISLAFVIGTWALVGDRRFAREKVLDIEEGHVATIDGLLSWAYVASHRFVSREIKVGSRNFDLTWRPRLHVTLIPGFTYRAYVATERRCSPSSPAQEQTVAVVPP